MLLTEGITSIVNGATNKPYAMDSHAVSTPFTFSSNNLVEVI